IPRRQLASALSHWRWGWTSRLNGYPDEFPKKHAAKTSTRGSWERDMPSDVEPEFTRLANKALSDASDDASELGELAVGAAVVLGKLYRSPAVEKASLSVFSDESQLVNFQRIIVRAATELTGYFPGTTTKKPRSNPQLARTVVEGKRLAISFASKLGH